ncbi:MAG: hypothetical protein H8D23_34570, partial [Candidatus Brocadiales bacterium]|nr:hypothetical protein [Candidatus Brocadiales bacterium]
MYTDELRNRISLLRKALVERPDSFDTLVETVHEILFPGSKYHQDLRSTYEILMILGETLLENENARKELAVAKTISDLPTRAHILAKNLAVEQSIQGDVNGAKICFELATISARLIDSTVERDEAIEGIIDLQLEVALYGNSVSNVKHLSGEYARSKVRAKIAKAQAIAGEFENAVLLIAEVNDVELRAPAYANVAMLQANKGQLSDAKFSFGKAAKNADQITDSFDRDVVWSKIAECLASAGLVEDALKTAKSIDDGWEYSRTLATIAVIQSSRGHKRNANEIFKQAVEAAESFNDYNNFLSGALAFIVKKMLEANELSDAKEVLGRIKDPAARSDALLTFANKHVELHQQSDARTSFTTAFEYSIKIGDNFYRPEVQVKIIDGMAGAEYFEEAIDLTSQIENESDRKRALSTIAANQAKSNLFAQAKHTLFRVDIPHLRNSVLHVLAVGQAEVGLFSDSLASLKQIPKHDTLFEKSIECLVQKMGEAGDYDNALGVIQLGGNLFTKAELCGGIACKQFISGDVRGAEKSYNTAI